MTCQESDGKTVLDFYLSLSSRESPKDCRGPIVSLALANPIVSSVFKACETLGQEYLVSSSVVDKADQYRTNMSACMGHWLSMCAITSVVGSKEDRKDYLVVANGLMITLCGSIDWDYKELDNFLRSYNIDNRLA